MPNESTEAHVRLSIPIIRYLQREALTALEFNLVLYIFEHSINFKEVKNHGKPLWVQISPSEYSRQFGFARVAVSRALTKLAYLGIFEVTTFRQMGVEYRNFRVVETEKVGRVLSDVSQAVTKKLQGGVAKKLQPKLEKTNRKDLRCNPVHYRGVTQFNTALLPSGIQACNPVVYGQLENPDRFQGVADFQECIKNLKNYFNNCATFLPPSYYDLISPAIPKRIRKRNFKIVLKRSIDRHGLFSTWMAVNVQLRDKDVYFDQFEALTAILKTHDQVFSKIWEEMLLEIDNVFYELTAFESECDSKMKDFEHNAHFFLAKKRTGEKSSLIFLYDSFESTAIEAKLVSCGSIDVFRDKIIKKLNLFFKNKILGDRELILDQIEEELLG